MHEVVSVIIPTWNRAITIEKSIESALNQTYKNIEIIVVDDGSTDNTSRIILSKFKTVRYIKIKHSGLPGVARNVGIRASKGKWIAFLDSDDIWDKSKIKKQLDFLLQKGGLACSSNAYITNNHSKKTMLDFNRDKLYFRELIISNFVVCSSALVSKNLVYKASLFSEKTKLKALEDYLLWLKIATITPIYYIKEPLVYYRDDPNNSIRKEDVKENVQRRVVFFEYSKWSLFRFNIKNTIFSIFEVLKAL